MFLRRMAALLSAAALSVGLSTAAAGTAHAAISPSPDWNEIFSAFDHNFNNTLCIDDPSGNLANNTPLWLWHCNSNLNQRWLIAYAGVVNNGTPVYAIILRRTFGASGDYKCIGFKDGVRASGQRLALVDCNGNFIPTTWVLDNANGTSALMGLRDPSSNLCMAVADFSDNNGTPLIAKTCDSNPNDSSMSWELG
jgi:ricin-type beta-trefoil lectin protein